MTLLAPLVPALATLLSTVLSTVGSPLLAAVERDQSVDGGSILTTLAWIVGGIVAFGLVVWLGIRALYARNDMTETDTY